MTRAGLVAIVLTLAIAIVAAWRWNAPQDFTLGKITYRIPASFTVSGGRGGTGELNTLGIRALLPDMTARTWLTANCFNGKNVDCRFDVVTIGITRGAILPAERRLQNIQQYLAENDRKMNHCGLEYLSDKSPTERTKQGFNYFLKNLATQN